MLMLQGTAMELFFIAMQLLHLVVQPAVSPLQLMRLVVGARPLSVQLFSF